VTQPSLARQTRNGRVYWSERAQRDLPSITNVIGVLDKPGIPRWAAKLVAEYAIDHAADLAGIARADRAAAVDLLKNVPWRSTESSAERGDQVHAYLEAHAKGEELPEVTGPAAAYLPGLRLFLHEHQPRFVQSEVTVFSETYGYAGTFDFVAELPHLGATVLGDLKTGKRTYPQVGLQLAANRWADRMELGDGLTHPVPTVDYCVVLRVHQRGYELRPVAAERREMLAFRAALALWHWQHLPQHEVLGPRIAPPQKAAA
jgi:hypothetical protein